MRKILVLLCVLLGSSLLTAQSGYYLEWDHVVAPCTPDSTTTPPTVCPAIPTKFFTYRELTRLGEVAYTSPWRFPLPSPPVAGERYSVSAFADGFAETAAASVVFQAPTSCPDGMFLAEYYATRDLTGTVLRACEGKPAYDWKDGGPPLLAPRTNLFSVRWTGRFDFMAGTNVFTVTADDGVRLLIDSKLVINQWKDQAPTSYTANVILTAGVHTVTMEYYENAGGAYAALNWVAPPPPPPPLQLTCPANIQTSTSVVTFTPTPIGGVGPYTTPTCMPASGTAFPAGTTPVSCQVSDSTATMASCQFSVTYTPPPPPVTLSCPSNFTTMLANPTWPDPIVSGGVPPLSPASCIPASGSTFVVGETTVSCQATDSLMQVGSCGFVVTFVSLDVEAPVITTSEWDQIGGANYVGRIEATDNVRVDYAAYMVDGLPMGVCTSGTATAAASEIVAAPTSPNAARAVSAAVAEVPGSAVPCTVFFTVPKRGQHSTTAIVRDAAGNEAQRGGNLTR